MLFNLTKAESSSHFTEQSTHLTFQPISQEIPRVYIQINPQEHSNVRQQLMSVPKNQIPNYQPKFDLGMLNEYVAPSLLRRCLGQDYENDAKYFAKDFTGNFTEHVFHCVLNYQYPGFCKYAQSLNGFDDFILSMTEQLKPGSELQKRMLRYWGGKEAFAALQRIHKTKVQQKDAQVYQAKYQAIRELLQDHGFNQDGLAVLQRYEISDQFTYHGNLIQMAQLKKLAHFFNDLGTFEQTFGNHSELQQLVQHATGFGCLSSQANQNHNHSLSQTCLEIGQNILALGRGLKDGVMRNITNIYHMLRYPSDTAESLSHLVKNIGTGIGKIALTLAKHDAGLELNDENLIRSAHQDIDDWIAGGRELYEAAKQILQNKSKLERYELVGSYAVDLLLLKGLPNVGRMPTVQKLAEYKPQAFAKLGKIGQEINQTIGLICAKVPKYLRQSEHMVAAGEASLAEINLLEELNSANSLKNEALISSSTSKISELTKIVEFEKSLLALQVEYGTEILHDAKQALRLNEYKILNSCENEILTKLKQACTDIKYIQNKPHRHNFIYDVAQGGKVTQGSIVEGLTACAAEDKGIVSKLSRAMEREYDFLDNLGRKWDVKQINSLGLENNPEKKLNNLIQNIKKSLLNDEFVLVNTSNAKPFHLKMFNELITQNFSPSEIAQIKIIM